MVVVVSLRRDVAATLTHDKLNTKGGQGAFYHKALESCKTLNLTLGDDIRGNLGCKMGLIRKRANNKFCELEFRNQ